MADATERRRRTAAVLVEYHSHGLVARTARRAELLGLTAVVADNSGTYEGNGRVVVTRGNVGFGAACNAAVAELGADVDTLVFWNPDAAIGPEDLDMLLAAVAGGGWAAVAPAVAADRVRPYGFSYPALAREAIVVLRELVRMVRHGSAVGRARHERAASNRAQGVVSRPGRFGTAALLVVDRGAFESVGGFDERFFLYGEDLDLWDRLVGSGGRCGFLPAATARHDSGAGSAGSRARRAVLRWLGVETFTEIRGGQEWRWYRRLHRLSFAPRLGRSDDVVAVVRAGMQAGLSPTEIQRQVRVAARSAATPPSGSQRVRAGWGRTTFHVSTEALVLDVGSGVFPNERADVLCERSLVRPHRTAVVDRPLVVADAQALPFRSGCFGFVIASHLAEHVEHPGVLCAELARVAEAGYVETPSPGFERLFPEDNHIWRVRSPGSGRLRFERNEVRADLPHRIGRCAYRWYYAGQDKARPTIGGSAWARPLALLAHVVRATLNRAGVSITRCSFDAEHPLMAEVVGERRDVGVR